MRMCPIALLLAAGILAGQDAPEAKDARKQKARELLAKVDIALGSVEPEVHVIALAQLGGAWKPLDEKRALSYLQQAFTAAGALPEDEGRPLRTRMQSEIVKTASHIDLPAACELLRAMPPAQGTADRIDATDTVVTLLIAEQGFDKATEVLALTPEAADYPFAAARHLFEELPKGDSRRIMVFGNAAAAYRRRPGDGFRTFLGKHWQEVPREMAQAALSSVLNAVREEEDEPGAGESLENEKGTVKLAGRKSMELFDVLGALRALDPAELRAWEEKYPDLRTAAQRFPEGRPSVDGSVTLRSVARKDSWGSSFDDSDFDVIPPLSMFAGADAAQMQDAMRSFVAAQKKAGEAWAAFQKDPRRGLSLAEGVAAPEVRIELLIRCARELKKDAAATARDLLSKSDSLIAEITDGGDRMLPSISVAELAHDLGEDTAAWKGLERALAALVAVYKSDTDAERPNRALREHWPSTLGCRAIMWNAVKLFGMRSEELLESMPSPDVLLMAQIELARALLGVSVFDAEHKSMSMEVVL